MTSDAPGMSRQPATAWRAELLARINRWELSLPTLSHRISGDRDLLERFIYAGVPEQLPPDACTVLANVLKVDKTTLVDPAPPRRAPPAAAQPVGIAPAAQPVAAQAPDPPARRKPGPAPGSRAQQPPARPVMPLPAPPAPRPSVSAQTHSEQVPLCSSPLTYRVIPVHSIQRGPDLVVDFRGSGATTLCPPPLAGMPGAFAVHDNRDDQPNALLFTALGQPLRRRGRDQPYAPAIRIHRDGTYTVIDRPTDEDVRSAAQDGEALLPVLAVHYHLA